MEIVIVNSPAEIGVVVADAIEQLLATVHSPTLGLATGSSPLPVYAELIERHRAGRVGFAATTMFLLDEYVGLPSGHPQSYRSFICREFTDHIDLDPGALHGPDGTADDVLAACSEYETEIAEANGIGLQLLGVGADGHIGFNEPVSSLGSRTRLKTLADQTRADNARFFDSADDVPRHVLTQGIGTILDARHLVLVAAGEHKADPVARAVEGPLTAMVPASALQLHPHVTIVIDEAAATQLTQADYYRTAFENKPEWQTI